MIASGNDVAALQYQGYLCFFLTGLTHWYKDDCWTSRHPVCISSRKKGETVLCDTLSFNSGNEAFSAEFCLNSLWRTVSHDCLLTRKAGKLNIQLSNFYSRGRQRRNFLSGLTYTIWHDVIWILWCIKNAILHFHSHDSNPISGLTVLSLIRSLWIFSLYLLILW